MSESTECHATRRNDIDTIVDIAIDTVRWDKHESLFMGKLYFGVFGGMTYK